MSYQIKNIYSRCLVTILLVFMVVCSHAAAEPTAITVGVYENKPKVFLNKEGQPTGFFVELIEEIAREEGWKVKYKIGTWGECLSNLDNSAIDIMVDVAYSEARKERWNFNKEPVLSDWFQVYVGNESKINSIADLTGKKVAVLDQSIQADALRGHMAPFGLNCELVLLPDYHKVFQLLAEGKVDAAVINKYYGAAHLSSSIKETGIIFYPTRLHFAAPKNSNPQIISALDKHLVKMKRDRESFYYKSMDKWFAEKVAPYAIPTWLKQTIGGLASLIILLIGLSLFLKKRIKEQTSDLLSLTEKLRASEEQYRELFDNAPAAYFTIDAKNERVKRYNLGAQKMLGYAPEVLAEMKVLDLYSESPSGKGKAKEIFERFKHGESINDEELQMVNSDGKPLWVSLSVEPVKDIDGNVIESRSMAVNISNRKQLEEHLRQAQKMEAIGTLAGGIAHDFNNILAAILGFSEFVKRDLPEYSKAREDIEQVIQSGKRATELVKQILTFSRQTEQQRQPLQIHLVIKEALKFLRSSIPTTIAIQQNVVDCGLVMADPTQVHQIIMNLCTNAYHAMQETGGELDVSMEVVELTTEDYIDSLVMQPGPHVKLSVRDTGCGMSKELVERIFDPYFTTKKQGEGTGLGLSMVHGIVESHHGHITVYSEPGKGTEFHVYLPQVQRHDQILTEETGEKIPKGSGTVLVVDDEPIIGEMLRRMLGDLGYEVLLCASSTEALELFTQQRARIALVLTDMNMPVMNGAELVRRIKQLSPAMPVVLCTGFSEIMDEKKARRMGIDGFLMKPVILHKLAQTLHDILEKKGGSGPAV